MPLLLNLLARFHTLELFKRWLMFSGGNQGFGVGPWHIQNKPIIIQKWDPGLRTLEFNMAKLPIWVQLSHIPLELFAQRGISYIASALGNPFYMDRFTASQQRLAFAKVCVEIDAKMEIPKMIDVALRDGTIDQIYVDISLDASKMQ
ncbi:hypothetical protein DITRI_Ditri01bG0069800 [Diplodiscus trichospermus]